MPKIKLLIEVEANEKYCGECRKVLPITTRKTGYCCIVFSDGSGDKTIDLKTDKKFRLLRCKTCLKSEVSYDRN